MTVFDGKKEAEKFDKKILELVNKISNLKSLLIIQIGDNLSSEKYVGLKLKYCQKIGIPVIFEKIDPLEEDTQIIEKVRSLFLQDRVAGGIVQLPLPRESLKNVLNIIPYNKDIDMLSSTKKGTFYNKNFEFLPPVIRALDHFLIEAKINPVDLPVAVLGGGDLVGKPISFYLLSKKAKVSILDESNLYKRGKKIQADLVITAMGQPRMLDPRDLKQGSNLIDFGSAVIEGKTVGDLDMSINFNHLRYVSPSPGGMGPLVIRYLVSNLLNTQL